MVLRREDGGCVGAAMRDVWGLMEAIEAEAMGLAIAIEFLKGFRYQEVIIELDNQTVVNLVINRSYPRKYWGNLARSSAKFLSENPKISIRWVRRAGNEVAHYLARHVAVEPNSTWVGFAPPCIAIHIQKDVNRL
jgi:ribonuclease HI